MRNILILLLLSILLSGCSFLDRNTTGLFTEGESSEPPPASQIVKRPKTDATAKATTTSVPIEGGELEQRTSVERDILEVLWKIPEERPDFYIIEYGFTQDSLNFSVELAESEVEKFDHPQYGYVYRYQINNFPPNKNAFVALKTKSGEQVSERSEIFEVGN